MSGSLDIHLSDKNFKLISGLYSTLRTLIFSILHYFIGQTEPRILGLVVLHIQESEKMGICDTDGWWMRRPHCLEPGLDSRAKIHSRRNILI